MASQTTYTFVTLDVFTTSRFSGNPLAIVLVPFHCSPSQQQKQTIAREFNLSETVFLHEADADSSHRRIEIFTTTAELPFAGHPTIGSICHILGEQGSTAGKTLSTTLITKAGSIAVTYDTSTKVAEANIPHNLHVHTGTVPKGEITNVQSVGIPSDVEREMSATFPIVSIVKGMTFILVRLPSVEALQLLKAGGGPLLPELDGGWDTGFVAPYFYVLLGENTDGTMRLRTRLIEPGCGEDPATGSAACTLASFLALQMGGNGKRFRYAIEQGVEMGRRSVIGVKIQLDATGKAVEQVILSGCAVSIMQGTLSI
ncbi:hypothetical protein MMC16_001307 [Acarospora aff. strigata]|nr:hypothetical protein [Acarospora aff. strigata]